MNSLEFSHVKGSAVSKLFKVMWNSRFFLFICKGFVATLKENFGFLETSEHDKEVFFHYRFVNVI